MTSINLLNKSGNPAQRTQSISDEWPAGLNPVVRAKILFKLSSIHDELELRLYLQSKRSFIRSIISVEVPDILFAEYEAEVLEEWNRLRAEELDENGEQGRSDVHS